MRLRNEIEQQLNSHPVFAGPRASTVDAVLAGLAGMFLEKAATPEPPNMPGIRDFQQQEGLAAVNWLLKRWNV